MALLPASWGMNTHLDGQDLPGNRSAGQASSGRGGASANLNADGGDGSLSSDQSADRLERSGTAGDAGLYSISTEARLRLQFAGVSARMSSRKGPVQSAQSAPLIPAESAGSGGVSLEEALDHLGVAAPELVQGLRVMLKMLDKQCPESSCRLANAIDGLAAMLENGLLQVPPALDVALPDGAAVQAESAAAAASSVTVVQTVSYTMRIEASGMSIFKRGEEPPAEGDPLVLDLAGDGIHLRGVQDGVSFDIEGTGRSSQTAFIRGDDALLYLDANGNGVADNGRELFGDQDGHAHGFAELSTHDENADGRIDEADGVYDALRVWQDRNGDGTNQADESRTLREAGILSISLGYADTHEEDGLGNTITQRGQFTRTDGSTGLVADAMLAYYRR